MDGGSQKGFWSYVHADDDAHYGGVSRLADHLAAQYKSETGGRNLELFRDSAELKWGDDWRLKIREAIAESAYFIPIVTPSYFESEECRKELLEFAAEAKAQKRPELVMPIYFMAVKKIEEKDNSDSLVPLIAARQWEDWRNLRFLDEKNQPYRFAVNKMALRLVEISDESDSGGGGSGEPPDDKDDGGGAEFTEGGSGPIKPEEPVDEGEVEIRGPAGKNASPSASAVSQMGLLELLAAGEEALPRLIETMGGIGQELERVSDATLAASERIAASDEQGEGFKGRLAVTNSLARNLEDPANRLEELSAEYMGDLLVLDPAVQKMIEAVSQQSGNPEDVEEFFSGLDAMIEAANSAAEQMAELVMAMGTASAMSRELDAPLKRLRAAVQSLVDANELFKTWQEQAAAARA
ncbi:MAG TPA: toll/interleukin-1 receptor domain-containing protein [Solirubrobacterales bacterium]